jgi:hypothetical protein
MMYFEDAKDDDAEPMISKRGYSAIVESIQSSWQNAL